MIASTDTQLKLKYAITFQFQIVSRNILLINMQETVHNKGKVNT